MENIERSIRITGGATMRWRIASLTSEESYNDWAEEFKRDYPLMLFEMMRSENGRYDVWVSIDKKNDDECDCDDC